MTGLWIWPRAAAGSCRAPALRPRRDPLVFSIPLVLSALVPAVLLFAVSGAAATERRCAKAQAVVGLEKSLPTLAGRIHAGEAIRIVALGSSSTEGTPDMPREAIFASVLGRELAKEVLTPVEVVNKGKGGETIVKMVDRLQRDVINLRPDLVVWQLGVNDVLQMDGVESAVERMKVALDMLRAHDLPVVLVDLQSSPAVDRDKDTPVMQAAIEEAGKRQGVMHFHRHAFMNRLVETREVAMPDLVQGDGLHMTQLGHFCTGQLLAGQIAKASLMQRVSVMFRSQDP